MKGVFVTGSNTGVGKTTVAVEIVRFLSKKQDLKGSQIRMQARFALKEQPLNHAKEINPTGLLKPQAACLIL